MLKSCNYCGRIHDAAYDCGRRPKRIREKSDSEESAFRRKQIWTKLSKQIRERDNYLCQICFRNLYMTSQTFNHTNVSVHHIVPISEDETRSTDPYNLITVCQLHHELAESGYIPREELFYIAKEQEDCT